MRSAVLAAAFFLASLPAVGSAFTVGPTQLTPYFKGEYFEWREYAGGERLLRETGPLFAVGLRADQQGGAIHARERIEAFGGVVGYSGQTQETRGQLPQPVETDVDYYGVRIEVEVGPRLESAIGAIEPFAGAGTRIWNRNLRDSATAAGEAVPGYTESWLTGYARLGARWSNSIGEGNTLFVEGGGRYPFYAGNSVDYAGIGTVTFHPRGDWSGFAEAGLTRGRLEVALTYEGSRYSQSPMVQINLPPPDGPTNFFQPDSTSDIYGIRLGWRFK